MPTIGIPMYGYKFNNGHIYGVSVYPRNVGGVTKLITSDNEIIVATEADLLDGAYCLVALHDPDGLGSTMVQLEPKNQVDGYNIYRFGPDDLTNGNDRITILCGLIDDEPEDGSITYEIIFE